MEDKRFDLTPRQILVHLRDIEKKAARDSFRIYIPTKVADTAIIDDSVLAEEARRMLEFVGLYGYELDVTYAKTGDGVGGDCMNNSAERSVHIHVSDAFSRNWKATVAVLAHEICHKVLFVKGLYSPIEMMNEVYAELATIYFGFGELILSGYQAKDHCLGYLKPDTYKKINLLICVICGNIRSDVLKLQDIDPLADEAIAIWEKDDDKHALLTNCFKNAEKQLAEYYRNLVLLGQVVEKLRKDVKTEFDNMDKTYYHDIIEIKHTTIETFMFVYDKYCEHDFRNVHTEALNEAVSDALYALISKCREHDYVELTYNFTCPVCGTTEKNRLNEKGLTVRRCVNADCGRHITYNTDEWNATVCQRKATMRAQTEKDEIERRVKELVASAKRDAAQRVNHAQEVARSQIASARSDAAARVDDMKRNERRRYREETLAKVPVVLRWLVARYLK